MTLTDLIAAAPWREAVTYRDTWPHEYVLLQRDGSGRWSRPWVAGYLAERLSRDHSLAAGRCTYSSGITNTGS